MRKEIIISSILVISILALTSYSFKEADATHFRYTHINWAQTPDTYEVTFGGDHAWRTCFNSSTNEVVGGIVSCGFLNFGDNSGTTYYMKVAIDNNIGANWIFGPITDSNGGPLKHTYSGPGPWTASYSSGARISTLINAANAAYNGQVILDMNNGNTQGPKSALPPIVFCPIGTCNFSIPAVDGNGGDTQTFRKSTSSESGIPNQSFYEVDNNTGVVTFDTTGTQLGQQYALQVIIEERNSQGEFIGRTFVDFIVEISDQINNDPPEFVPPTPIDSTLVRAADGSTIQFDVKCSDPNGDNLTITGFSLPNDSVFSPNPITGSSPLTSTFSWVPIEPQTTTLTFSCLDENNGSALPTSIKIEVLPVCEKISPTSIRTLNEEECLPEGTVEGLEPTSEQEKRNGGDNQWDTRPTFGISHEDRQNQVVDSGFSFNGEFFTLTDNHHTDFEEQSVVIGTTNSFSAKVYADKKLKVQEFLFGIPNVGEAHLAELGVEVWYDRDGNIEDVKVVQKSDVIDAETVSVIHEKTKCLSTDPEPLCDTTTVSMTFLEPLADKVMAIKAIDYALRDQRTFLNEGFDISGDSLNPMASKMIPSNVKNQGLIEVTQLAKYSPYWKTDDGRMFEMNSFGSFNQVNQSFERFADTGDARTRLHSGFGGIMQYEQNRATQLFDSTKLISDLPDSFGYHFEITERFNEDVMQKIYEQQEIAKEILKEMDKQNRYY